MECKTCGEFFENILDHVRLMHPDALIASSAEAIARGSTPDLLLKPVTRRMNDEDWVCENCDEQFQLGQLYGEVFEDMVNDLPVVSLVCGVCYVAKLQD